MKEFIHTFSLQTKIVKKQFDYMGNAFPECFFYNSAEKVHILSKYADRGLRMEITYNTAKEKRYDRQHRDCKVKIMITPVKLLHPNEPMSKLYTPDQYRRACEQLQDLFKEIETVSGVNLWDEVKIKRIDIAKDVETESDSYSQEVIRMAKKALYKTGYHIWIPSAKDIERTGWKDEDSFLYNNHNQEVEAKIYNKLTDMNNRGYDTGNLKGLLRFELTLKRQYLLAKSLLATEHMTFEELPVLLCNILNQAQVLMQTHLVSPLWSGAMLRKETQKLYIRYYCDEKKSRRQKMINYRNEIYKNGYYANPTMEKHFSEAGISPLFLTGEIRYIPSFADLLAGTRDEKVECFLKWH